MGSRFSDDEPFASQRAAYSSFLSSAFQAAATRSISTVTQTMDSGEPFYTSVDLDGPSTNTLNDEPSDIYPFTDEASSLTPSPTTFATATSSDNQNQNLPDPTAPAETTATPLPIAQGQHDGDGGGLSKGQLAAAVVVPIIFTALLAVLALLILRRRRRSQQHHHTNDNSSSIRGAGFFGLREKWGSLKSSASSQKEPEVTSTQNRAYMSGLDTSSRSTSQQNSGEYDAAGRPSNDPPPPYKVNAQGAPVLPVLSRNLSRFDCRPATPQEMAQLQPPRNVHLQPPASPISPLSPTGSAFLTPWAMEQRPDSARSARSFNSDAHSETASIHSARAARMSVGGPNVITPGGQFTGSRAGSLGDPFDDPSTPVPSLPGDALLQLEGQEQRRGSAESKASK